MPFSCQFVKNIQIGIVGRTGSGKSSLILAILRVIGSCEGKIFIDGIDISSIDLDELRQNIATIPQVRFNYQ